MGTNEHLGTKPDTLPPWPSEPPKEGDPALAAPDERTSGLIVTGDPRVAALVEQMAALEKQRAADAEQIAKMTADLARLDDLARAEKALRESSLVQIRRLSALERELEGTKTALTTATHEREELRARAEQLAAQVTSLRDAFTVAEAGARDAAQALSAVTRALEVAGDGVTR